MSNTAHDLTDDTVCLPNISRAAFCQNVLGLAKRYDLNYAPSEDELYHCCEAIVIAWFMEGDERYSPFRGTDMNLIRIYLNARGLVRFRGE
jgi:hypothetical protein